MFKMMINIAFVSFSLIITEVISIRLVKVVVPPYELYSTTALLECQYELNNSDNKDGSKSSKSHHFSYDSNEQSDEGETLYSVKWYKDDEEFYRYVPKANPPQHSYKVDGIRVDVRDNYLYIVYITYDSILYKIYTHTQRKFL